MDVLYQTRIQKERFQDRRAAASGYLGWLQVLPCLWQCRRRGNVCQVLRHSTLTQTLPQLACLPRRPEDCERAKGTTPAALPAPLPHPLPLPAPPQARGL